MTGVQTCALPISSALATFACSLAESATTLDTPSSSAVFLASISESVVTSDVIIGRFLWEIIDDAQTSGWVTINTSQSTGWSIINNSESTTWTNIKTVN